MLLEGIADDGAVPVVILYSLNLRYPTQDLEGFVIELVNVRHMRVCDHYKRQGLHIAQAVSKPVHAQHSDTQ